MGIGSRVQQRLSPACCGACRQRPAPVSESSMAEKRFEDMLAFLQVLNSTCKTKTWRRRMKKCCKGVSETLSKVQL